MHISFRQNSLCPSHTQRKYNRRLGRAGLVHRTVLALYIVCKTSRKIDRRCKAHKPPLRCKTSQHHKSRLVDWGHWPETWGIVCNGSVDRRKTLHPSWFEKTGWAENGSTQKGAFQAAGSWGRRRVRPTQRKSRSRSQPKPPFPGKPLANIVHT